ncbi:unnamed protein product [Albugo candida]|uniref:Uncharacterized protein n=1 Tax=Albugo candida TaxID=65357 RepID=A0A024FUG3_9STRA|nr:unnamed protein product [Albugo candida]|eukprot:CCI10676.1 unnamed protein product [Albugo candida]
MQPFSMCAVFLTALMSMESPSRIIALSGIFNVTSQYSKGFTSCHECLVGTLGAAQIHLLVVNSGFRLYWIHSNSNAEKAFLSYCHKPWTCYLSNHLEHTYSPDKSICMHRDIKIPNEENGIRLLANAMNGEMLMELATFTNTKVSKDDPSSLIRKETNDIPVFLWKDYSLQYATLFGHLKKFPVIGMSIKEEVSPKKRIFIHEKDEPLMRCMVLPIPPQEGVCRECLAMHSTTFAIRTFHLLHGSKPSADVCVFLSNHQPSDIVSNCKKIFCQAIIHLNSIDCRTIHNIFPLNHQFERDKNKMTLEEVQQVLQSIAYRRTARRQTSNSLLSETFEPEGSLNILGAKDYFCIEVRALLHSKRRCIDCILKDVTGYHLVFSLSLYIFLIFTHSIRDFSQCKTCKFIQVRRPDDCGKKPEHYLNKLEVYPKPSHLDMRNELYESCIAAYQGKCDYACIGCIEHYLEITNAAPLIGRSPLLFDVSMAASKMTLKVFSKLSHECVVARRCSRIQAVPSYFCSTHRAFKVTQSRRGKKAIKFNQDPIPVGIWPPLQHQAEENLNGFMSPRSSVSWSGSADGPQIWPASNNIALVEIKFADSGSYDCLKCLAEHTELFFFYRSEVERSGYVWMRPALSNILSSCVGMHCSSLSYNENGMQMRRPVGLPPVTTIDIILSLVMFNKRNTKAPHT